jgi:aspartate-semialdehyde dehydrogenase
VSPLRTALLGATTLQGKDLIERLRQAHAPIGKLVLAETGLEESVATPVAGEWVVSTPLLDEALEGAALVLCCEVLPPEARAAVIRLASSVPVLDLAGGMGGHAFDARLTGATDARLPGATDARRGVTLDGLGPGVHASPKGASLLLAALARAAIKAGAPAASPCRAVACEPASELGRPAVDELHAQAVAVLSFQPVPSEIYGRQAVHDVLSPGPGGEADEQRIRRQARDLGAGDCSVLVLRPGLFHGVGMAVHAPVRAAAWRKAMADEPRLELLPEDESGDVSPVAAVAAERALVGRVIDDGQGGAWAWASADTLAHGAVGNVVELLSRG